MEQLLHAVRDPTTDPIGTLLSALTSPDSEVRLNAVRFLREIPSPRAVQPLLPLVADPNDAIRCEVVETLGYLGDRTALPALLYAANDSEELVRVNVAEALGSLAVVSPEVTATLCRLLNDPYFPVRIFAAESLGDLEDSVAYSALKNAQNDIPPVRVWVYFALSRLGESFPLTETLRYLRHGGVWTRTQSAKVLRRVAPPEAALRIRQALEVALRRSNPPAVEECLRDYATALDEDAELLSVGLPEPSANNTKEGQSPSQSQ
jgi:HEAT repeat protein